MAEKKTGGVKQQVVKGPNGVRRNLLKFRIQK